jgi:hypothetical protein
VSQLVARTFMLYFRLEGFGHGVEGRFEQYLYVESYQRRVKVRKVC